MSEIITPSRILQEIEDAKRNIALDGGSILHHVIIQLDEQLRQLRIIMQGQEIECKHRERQDKAYRVQLARKDDEIRRLADSMADILAQPIGELPALRCIEGRARELSWGGIDLGETTNQALFELDAIRARKQNSNNKGK